MDAKFIKVFAEAGLLDGLLGYWKLDETSGNAVDSSGNGYTGTSSNITYTASGKIGRCYTFNGSTSNINFGDVISPATGITLTAWVKTTSLPASEGAIIYKASYATNWCGYRLTVYSTGTVGFFLGDNTGNYLDITFGTTVLNGNWHFIGGTWDGTNAYIYLDDTRRTVTSWTGPIAYTSVNLYSGYNGSSMLYQGDIDEAGIWNKALTQDNMLLLFDSGNGKTHPFSG